MLSVQQCKYFLDALCTPSLTVSKDKSPGNDGLRREFYIQFYNIIENVFIRSVNHSYKVGELSLSQNKQ